MNSHNGYSSLSYSSSSLLPFVFAVRVLARSPRIVLKPWPLLYILCLLRHTSGWYSGFTSATLRLACWTRSSVRRLGKDIITLEFQLSSLRGALKGVVIKFMV